jgi:hypothetical protein
MLRATSAKVTMDMHKAATNANKMKLKTGKGSPVFGIRT